MKFFKIKDLNHVLSTCVRESELKGFNINRCTIEEITEEEFKKYWY